MAALALAEGDAAVNEVVARSPASSSVLTNLVPSAMKRGCLLTRLFPAG